MASSGDTFKTSLFGQLKSYTTAVQGAFEQRIARPLLAFKRDLSRPTSESRAPNDQTNSTSSQPTRQESTSSSSPLEIIDVDTSGSFKSIFDKVKNTLSPSIRRRTSENPNHNENKVSQSTTKIQSPHHHHHHSDQNKAVSFAENIDNDSDSYEHYSLDDREEIVRNAQTLADQILIASIHQATGTTQSKNQISSEDDDEEFQRNFHSTIKPRRVFNDNKEELVYQDLSAEIVAYVLKHAIRTLKKEQEQEQLLLTTTTTTTITKKEQSEDFIDLK